MQFWASGKLLISAEYSVLRGALALSIPTRFGQTLEVTSSEEAFSSWNSLNDDGTSWFNATFDSGLDCIQSSDDAVANFLSTLLKTAKAQNENAFKNYFQAITKLEFDRHWGLGSSSTLIALVAQWAEVDAMNLFFSTQNGSGYDVATALINKPIFYELQNGEAKFKSTTFDPPFKDQIHFLYLGSKQFSDKEVVRFSEKTISISELNHISELTRKIQSCTNLEVFEKLLIEHEHATSKMLGYNSLKEKHFPDYPRAIKSLGAWGGDFALIVATKSDFEYFYNKGFRTILSWQEMIGT